MRVDTKVVIIKMVNIKIKMIPIIDTIYINKEKTGTINRSRNQAEKFLRLKICRMILTTDYNYI
jgi:hypothetical protein